MMVTTTMMIIIIFLSSHIIVTPLTDAADIHPAGVVLVHWQRSAVQAISGHGSVDMIERRDQGHQVAGWDITVLLHLESCGVLQSEEFILVSQGMKKQSPALGHRPLI